MTTDYIARPRVERRLRDAVARTPLTLLRAPLGAGKSVAAAMAFAEAPGLAWMDARPWHRGAFARAFVDAVRGVREDFGRMTLGAIEAQADAAHLGATFARELAHLDEPLLLVVDNAHVFLDEPDFARFAEAAIVALPSRARVVMLGRSLPEFSAGSLFASGRAAMVEGELLAFDAADVRALSARFGRVLDDEAVRDIERATEGWAAGVTLAITAPGGAALAGSAPVAQAYLTEELLERLGNDAVTFVERASVFETLDPRILEESDAFANARERLTELLQNGAPLSDAGGERVRMHPVLRDVAARRLRERGGESAANRDAARAYARVGETAAALFHADAAGDAATAAEFLRAHAQAAVATGDRARVRALAERVDADGSDADVRWYVDALLEKSRGSDAAREKFARAAEEAARTGDAAIAFHARAQLLEHDLGHGVTARESDLEELARLAQPLGVVERAAERTLRGWSLAVARDFPAALQTIAQPPGVADPETRFNTDVLRAYILTALGDAEAAEETLDALVAFLERGDRVVLQTLTLIWFARLALVWGKSNVAADAAAQAERLAGALDLRAEEAALYAALAEIATHAGDAAAAARYAERARTRAERAWYSADVQRVRAFAEIALARAAFLDGDYAVAMQSAQRAAAQPQTPASQRAIALSEAAAYAALFDESACAPAIARARAAAAQAVPADAADAAALAVADDLLAFLDAANGRATLPTRRRALVTLEYAGLALRGGGRSDGATSAFETALNVYEREGPRFEARVARAYAKRFGAVRISANGARDGISELTPRESEILTLLVEGLTNKELAQRLTVSPRTVETHVERILSKLEVASRSRAIAKALRLGLVRLPA